MTDLASLLNWESIESKLVEALRENADQTQEIRRLFGAEPAILLRNWYGQLALLLPCGKQELERSNAKRHLQDLQRQAGALALPQWLVCRDELFGADQYWSDPGLIDLLLPDRGQAWPALKLLERQDKEKEWLRTPSDDVAQLGKKAKRCVFFSIKGGVGRSTALVMLSIELARQGKKVLVLDGDFESPGLSSSLLPRDEGQPDYGIVDWLTAQALGADQQTLADMARRHIAEASPLNAALELKGQILVSPAYGKLTEAYVLKLGRLYRMSKNGLSYAQRLQFFFRTIEEAHIPDVILFDSRAGIDDTAAVALTQLHADISFLFAINTTQTWDSYALLFKHWRRNPALFGQGLGSQEGWSLSQTLRVVAALSPQAAIAPDYFESLLDNAYDCFQAIYDDDSEGEGAGYSPAPGQADAPHAALRIGTTDDLRAFDPLKKPSQVADAQNIAAFSDFLTQAQQLLAEPTQVISHE
jgi:CobQ/CobB/MinD/ParA nucleotide binding domain